MTAIIDDYKAAFGVMLHPGTNAAKPLTIGGALSFYYKAMLIPLILQIIIWLALGTALGGLLGSIFGAGSTGAVFGAGLSIVLIIGIIIAYVILIPIGMFIYAAFLHGIGKGIKALKGGGYSDTFSAVTYGIMPEIALSWIPIVSLIGGIWSLVVTIISLSKIQKTSGVAAFGVWLLTGIVFGIIYFLLIVVAGV